MTEGMLNSARRWLERRLARSRYQKNFLQVASANVIAQVLPLLLAPVMTRLYSPHDYGVLATFMAWLTFATVLAGMRIDWLISSAKAARQALAYFHLGSLVVVAFSILWATTVIFKPRWLDEYARGQDFDAYLGLIPVASFLSAMSAMFVAWFVRQASFSAISQSRITQSTTGVVCSLVAGFFSLGALGLVSSTMASLFIGLAVLFWKADVPKRPTRMDYDALKLTFQKKRHRILIVGITGFINAVGLNVPILLIGAFYSSTELGWYAFAARLAVAPIQTVTGAVAQSFWGELTHSRADHGAAVITKFRSTIATLSKFAVLVALVCVLAPLIVGPIFGREKWAPAGTVLLLLVPYLVTQVVVSPLASVVTVYGHELWLFFWDASRTICVTVCFVISHLLGLSFSSAVMIFSLVMAGFYLHLLVKMYLIIKSQPVNIHHEAS